MFNVTFNNSSAISWQVVLLVEVIGVPREKYTDLPQISDTHFRKCCIEYTSPWTIFGPKKSVLIGSWYIGRCKYKYHAITTTTAPKYNFDYGKIIYSYKLFHLNDMQASTLFLLEVLIKFNDVGSNPVEGRTKHWQL
jgi:hypothetical protein